MRDVNVRSIIVKGTKATGVNAIVGGKAQEISAAREVIVSSGAIGSPKLLLQSGIGPKAQLEALGLPQGSFFSRWSVGFTGAAPGTYTYVCQIHSGMEGTIVVH